MESPRHVWASRQLRFVAVSLCAAVVAFGAPHRGVHERIAAATARIREEREDAELYVRRAALYEEHADWAAALGDLRVARALRPGLAETLLVEGRVLRASGELAEARTALDRYVALTPRDARGYVARARLLAELGERAGAVDDYGLAIACSDPAAPDLYVERARLEAAAGPGGRARALAGLEQGLERLGPAVALVLTAVEIEVEHGRHDAALARLEQLALRSARQERWLVEQGDVLRAAGRADDAERRYVGALSELRRLPPRKRALPAVAEVERRARRGLEELQRARRGGGS